MSLSVNTPEVIWEYFGAFLSAFENDFGCNYVFVCV